MAIEQVPGGDILIYSMRDSKRSILART